VSDKGRFGGPKRAAVLSAGHLYNEEMCRMEQNEQTKHPQTARAILNEIHLEREAKDKLFAIAERYHPSSTETLVSRILKIEREPRRTMARTRQVVCVMLFPESSMASWVQPVAASSKHGSVSMALLSERNLN